MCEHIFSEMTASWPILDTNFLVRILLGFSIFTDKFGPNSGVRIKHEGVLYSRIYGIVVVLLTNASKLGIKVFSILYLLRFN